MSKLLSRAKANLIMAEHLYTRVGEDDTYLDSCCYVLQQSVEMALKYLVEMAGERYAENHDLRANLNILARADYSFPFEKEIRSKAKLLYEWESESRYRESFVAAVQDVQEVFELARGMIRYLDELVVPAEVEEVEDM